jgi:prepilin-type N-terminal cleavage/methylation domain-containing protein
MSRIKNNVQSGFTIVELMIATLVFSVILLVITYGVLSFTNRYYKGINSSTTQNTARSALDSMSQAIQFGTSVGASTFSSPDGVFCAGSKMFLYTPGKLYSGSTPGPGQWGLYEFNNPATGCVAPASAPGGAELLSKNMRVANLSVTQPDPLRNLWQVDFKVAYGAPDLLCAPLSQPGSCVSSAATLTDPQLHASDVTCKSEVGSQFCSVSALSTTVEQRLPPN